MFYKFFLFCLFLFLGVSCQTLDIGEKARFTKKQKSYFSDCSIGDGYSFIELSLDGKPKFQGDFEWSLIEEDYFFEILSPFGDSLLKGAKKENLLFLGGKGLDRSFELKVDKEGYLHFKNHWIGLKSKELSCFLKRKFSSDWLSKESYFLGDSKENFYIKDGKRTIVLEFSKAKKKVCSEISWQSFWIFKTSGIKICFEDSDIKRSKLNIDQKIELKIKEIYKES